MKYSIITINFNNKEGLRKTIESVVNQTFKDFEYIIIDGGSTDGSVNVIKEHADNIDYWVSEPDRGIYNAMNKGILQAHGEYLNFMNSGDCFYDNSRLQLVEESNINADIIVGKDLHIDNKTKVTHASCLPRNLNMFRFYVSTIPHQSAFIKRTLFSKHMYNEDLKIVADWEFYLKSIIFEGCSVELFNDIVAMIEGRGVCNNYIAVQKERKKILEDFFPIGIRKEYDMLKQLGENAFDNYLYICNTSNYKRYLNFILKIMVRLHKTFVKK